jgi:hypothetical protein
MSMRKTSLLLLHSPYECFDPPEDANALAILHYKFEAPRKTIEIIVATE